MCRTGCRTKDHRTWGECARAARLQIDGYSLVVDTRLDQDKDRRLGTYAALRKEGLQPKTTSWYDVRRAENDGGIPKILQQVAGQGAWSSQPA
jgi:hypothetical protein